MYRTLVDIVATTAGTDPDRRAFTFLLDGDLLEHHTSYSDLDRDARAVAAHLGTLGRPGDRIVILTAPGPGFLQAFFGCIYAGMIAVPAFLPDMLNIERSVPRLRAIAQDAEALAILTDEMFEAFRDELWRAAPDLAQTPWVLVESALTDGDAAAWSEPGIDADSTAFIQYTSGSTSVPKGVVLTHGNLLDNSEVIARRCRLDLAPGEWTGVSWLPPYHDMGLIGGILQPLYEQGSMVLMSPMDFLARPARWLHAISRHRSIISPAPNFAYELSVRRTTEADREQLDLSSWRVAFNGAEPVRPSTLERFDQMFSPHGWRPETMLPCYGLAEATLMVTGHGPERPAVILSVDSDALAKGEARTVAADDAGADRIVSVGDADPSIDLRIVDPETNAELTEDRVGEIWMQGGSVGSGYWGRRRQTRETFEAHTAAGDGPFMRTGDLGFLHGGDLFIVGRIKDVIIIRGRNLYPQDVELLVEQVDAIRAGCISAFAVAASDGSTDALGILAEVNETKLGDPDAVFAQMRSLVVDRYQVGPAYIGLIPARTIPKTSSGKVQRQAARRLVEEGELRPLVEWPPQQASSDAVGAGDDAHEEHPPT